MTPSLAQLAELVRQAEAKTRARKVEAEVRQAADRFLEAERRSRRALERMRVAKPACARAAEQADADEQMLRDLVRKLAQFKSSLTSDADAEQLVATSEAEIANARSRARDELEAADKELAEARGELRTAVDAYRQVRRELERLMPELVEQFVDVDRLLWDAESHFPGGQLQLLAHEVEAGAAAFGHLAKLEQYARLKVWIGRFRYHQAGPDRDGEGSQDIQDLAHKVFHQLKFLSRQYEPGYIEAFRQDYSTDWAAYVAEAQDQLVQAVESQRRARAEADGRDRAD